MAGRRFLILTILAATLGPAAAAEIKGRVVAVLDGDTLRIDATTIRLCGVDAPERREPGHEAAAAELRRLALGRPARCVPVGDGTPCDGRSPPVSHGRIVAQCFVTGRDLGTRLVATGFACDWTRFSGGYYSAAGGRRCP